MQAISEKVLDITTKATALSDTVTGIVEEIRPKIAAFLTKAGANVLQTAGKAQLSLKLIVNDHPRDGLYVELSGVETLCAGKGCWSARIENEQFLIDFAKT